MQERLQKQMEELKVEGTAGGGMVTVTMSGARKVLGVKISPEVFRVLPGATVTPGLVSEP